MVFSNKLVAVLNEKIAVGTIMNALAHMSLGLGSKVGKEALRFTNYIDGNNKDHPYISEMPFMILKANSNKIRILREEAIKNDLIFVDYLETMTEGGFCRTIGPDKTNERGRLGILWNCSFWRME